MHAPTYQFELWLNGSGAAALSWLRRFALQDRRPDEAHSQDRRLRTRPVLFQLLTALALAWLLQGRDPDMAVACRQWLVVERGQEAYVASPSQSR